MNGDIPDPHNRDDPRNSFCLFERFWTTSTRFVNQHYVREVYFLGSVWKYENPT